MASISAASESLVNGVDKIKLGDAIGDAAGENKGDSDDSDDGNGDGDGDGDGEAITPGPGATSGSKKKKKKKPKKKVSSVPTGVRAIAVADFPQKATGSNFAGTVPAEESAPAPESDEERQRRIERLESGPERLEIPLHGLLEERVSILYPQTYLKGRTDTFFHLGQVKTIDILDSLLPEVGTPHTASSTPSSLI